MALITIPAPWEDMDVHREVGLDLRHRTFLQEVWHGHRRWWVFQRLSESPGKVVLERGRRAFDIPGGRTHRLDVTDLAPGYSAVFLDGSAWGGVEIREESLPLSPRSQVSRQNLNALGGTECSLSVEPPAPDGQYTATLTVPGACESLRFSKEEGALKPLELLKIESATMTFKRDLDGWTGSPTASRPTVHSVTLRFNRVPRDEMVTLSAVWSSRTMHASILRGIVAFSGA
jgi:hypothetical protein